MSLSKQSIAPVLTTKIKETKHHIGGLRPQKRNRINALANKTNYITLIWHAFTTSSLETERALFLQPQSLGCKPVRCTQ